MSSETRLGGGTIQSTLFAAIDDAQLPDAIGGQLAEMFSTEIDFHRELKRGDSFTALPESDSSGYLRRWPRPMRLARSERAAA